MAFARMHPYARTRARAGGGAAGGAAAVAGPKAGAGFATYATGIVYGLQPDALFVVVPALALPTKAAAVAYCSMFVIGTVLAMGGYTLVIGAWAAVPAGVARLRGAGRVRWGWVVAVGSRPRAGPTRAPAAAAHAPPQARRPRR